VSRVRAFVAAAWEFVVGDDWRIAIGVVAALGATALLDAAGASSWWVLPVAVAALLGWSLRREARLRRGGGPSGQH
jgi:hypothetical protein